MEPGAAESPVVVDQRGPVVIITINRPHVRNAINRDVAIGIAEAMDFIEAERDVRAAVLTGAGGYFSSGMDLAAFEQGQEPEVPGRGFAGFVEQQPTKPLIAAVEGFAVAGGVEIALACDLIVASAAAFFSLPEVCRGLMAVGPLIWLPKRVPYHIAMELLLTGRKFTAIEAVDWGLVNRVADPGHALDVALELAMELAANAPLAVAASKKIARNAPYWSSDEAVREQRRIADPVFESADALEGARAFLEKRTPNWRGW